MHDTEKLYIVTRRDIAPGLQVAQSVHAAFEFAMVHPIVTEHWIKNSNNICVLSVEDELELMALYFNAKMLNLDAIAFREPDLDNEFTAIAIEPCPESKRLVSRLELALK